MITPDTLALVCWLDRQKALSQAAHDAIDRELDGDEILQQSKKTQGSSLAQRT